MAKNTQVIKTTFKVKRGLSEKWIELNPILSAGEPGCELDTGKLKIGNGETAWVDLPYVGAECDLNNYIQKADMADYLAPYLEKNQIASGTILGAVKSSDDENKIKVLSDGTMEINSLNITKLVQSNGDKLILSNLDD